MIVKPLLGDDWHPPMNRIPEIRSNCLWISNVFGDVAWNYQIGFGNLSMTVIKDSTVEKEG